MKTELQSNVQAIKQQNVSQIFVVSEERRLKLKDPIYNSWLKHLFIFITVCTFLHGPISVLLKCRAKTVLMFKLDQTYSFSMNKHVATMSLTASFLKM